MKKIITLFILAYFGYSANAQIQPANVDKAKNYVVTKVVYEYLKEESPKFKKENKFNIIKGRLESNNVNTPLEIDTLNSLLQGDFSNTKTDFVDKIKEISIDPNSDTVEASKAIISAIYSVPDSKVLKSKGVSDLRAKLQSEVRSMLTKEPAKPQEVKIPVVASQPINSDDKDKTEKDGFFAFKLNFWNHVLPFALILIVFVISMSRIGGLNRRIEKRKSEISEINNKPFNVGSDRDLSRLEKKVEDMRYSMSLLQSDVDYLKKARKDNNASNNTNSQKKDNFPSNTQNETNYPNQSIVTKQQEQNIFYMGSPIENFFPKNSRSNDYKKGFVLYKFSQATNPNEANFEFVSDEETIKHIRSNSMEIVNPACVSQNSPTINTNYVKTVNKGFARYENDRWNIIDKALIKFE